MIGYELEKPPRFDFYMFFKNFRRKNKQAKPAVRDYIEAVPALARVASPPN
jgi:hypothetical protein